jgi:phospholipase/carboxylesterase
MHYESSYSYPLIVWMHSDGDDRNQLARIMPELSMRNYVGVGPQAAVGNESRGFSWEQTPASIDHSIQAVCDAVDHARMTLNINSERIFLAGYGAGGTMAYRVGMEIPEVVSGIVSLNGPMPSQLTPLRDWMRCRELPLFWGHCRKSIEFGEQKLCDQLKLLHIAGFSVTLRQYPNGDELPTQMLDDLDGWIMGMIKSSIV